MVIAVWLSVEYILFYSLKTDVLGLGEMIGMQLT